MLVPVYCNSRCRTFVDLFSCRLHSYLSNNQVEESYWIKQPDGNQMHIKATKESKLEALPKVGDKIAAQITSRGEVYALKKIDEFPQPKEMGKPSQSLGDLRQNQ